MRISWAGVPYSGQNTNFTNTFHIEFDSFSGFVEIGGLSGVATSGPVTNVTRFLGISPGNLGPTTDPGTTNFNPLGPYGGVGGAALVTDMLYDFNTGPLPTFASGPINSILFMPSGGNYTWIAY